MRYLDFFAARAVLFIEELGFTRKIRAHLTDFKFWYYEHPKSFFLRGKGTGRKDLNTHCKGKYNYKADSDPAWFIPPGQFHKYAPPLHV